MKCPSTIKDLETRITLLRDLTSPEDREEQSLAIYDDLFEQTCLLGLPNSVNAGLAYPYERFPEIYRLWQTFSEILANDPALQKAMVSAKNDPYVFPHETNATHTLSRAEITLIEKARDAKNYCASRLDTLEFLLRSPRTATEATQEIKAGNKIHGLFDYAANSLSSPEQLKTLQEQAQEKRRLAIFTLEVVLIPYYRQKQSESCRSASFLLERYENDLKDLKERYERDSVPTDARALTTFFEDTAENPVPLQSVLQPP